MNKEINKIIPGETSLIFLGGDHDEYFEAGKSYLVIGDEDLSFLLIDDFSNDSRFLKTGILKYFKIKEESKPVYTQERYNIGAVPEEGVSFLVGDTGNNSRINDFEDKEVTVIATTRVGDFTIITFTHPTYGVGCGMYHKDWVKPINTRTDEQKAIDDLKEQTSTFTMGLYSQGVIKAIIAGKISGITFTGSK